MTADVVAIVSRSFQRTPQQCGSANSGHGLRSGVLHAPALRNVVTINMALLGTVGFGMHWLVATHCVWGCPRKAATWLDESSRSLRSFGMPASDAGSNLLACPSACADPTGAPSCLRPLRRRQTLCVAQVSRQTSRERAPGLQQRASKQTRAGVFWRPRRGRATIVKSLRGSAVCPARDS